MKIKVFGLLHLAENEQSAMNISIKHFREQILIYVNNASVLSRSLSVRGIDFELLTNKKHIIEEYALIADDGFSLIVTEIPFITKVPAGVRFYSAHFKIDALRYLASLPVGGYYALCDLDMVCINVFPKCLYNIINAGIPLCYDISDQVIPAYGHDVIMKDLSVISGLESEGRWLGGEFISGTAEFFNRLVREIDSIYGNYVANIASLHHIGDEAVTSAAMERLKRQGVYIADAGSLFIVGRFWNARVAHPQKSFAYYKNCFLLHLPADKRLLSEVSSFEKDILEDFVSIYEGRLNSLGLKLKRWACSTTLFIMNASRKTFGRMVNH